MTTKILALTDALGNLVRFVLLPGQRFDTVGVPPLIEGLAFGALIADKAFDSNAIIADLDARGAKVVISQHPRRAKPLAIDVEMYKWRHLIENFFGRLKEFKRIAMRADKTDQSFASMIHLAAAVINSDESQQTLAYCGSMIFSENRHPPPPSRGQAFSGSCSRIYSPEARDHRAAIADSNRISNAAVQQNGGEEKFLPRCMVEGHACRSRRTKKPGADFGPGANRQFLFVDTKI